MSNEKSGTESEAKREVSFRQARLVILVILVTILICAIPCIIPGFPPTRKPFG